MNIHEGITMTDYMQEIAKILKLAEVPGVEILQSDEAIFEATKTYIASLQDIAAKSDTWRLAAENCRRDIAELSAKCDTKDDALESIAEALINSSDVPTDESDTATEQALARTVKHALVYLHDARDSARMYSQQLTDMRKSTESTVELRTAELRQKVDALESQVSFHRDTAKNLEGANEGLAQALRIVLSTRA